MKTVKKAPSKKAATKTSKSVVAKKAVAKAAPKKSKQAQTWSTTLTMQALMRAHVTVEAESEEEAEQAIQDVVDHGNLLQWDWEVREIVEYPDVEYVERD